jgi:hypothetical protein
MQNLENLYAPALRSLTFEEPAEIVGQVLAMPVPLTWR